MHSSTGDKPPLIAMLRAMTLIRRFELKVNELFLRGLIPGTIHLSYYQEAVPVGVVSALQGDDFVLPTHRGHGHALAKGMAPEALFAELLAREAGCCHGKGGSLHIGDIKRGIIPANPIVGSSIPVAAGVAFAMKYRHEKRLAVSFFGDGTVNTGPFHEGLNLAAVWRLPVLFVCENNQYAISTPIKSVVLVDHLADRAGAYGIRAATVDGNDVVAVYEAAQSGVRHVRSGHGPYFLECVTYRIGGHKRDDPGAYRDPEEVEHWRALDPLPRARKRVLESGLLSEDEVKAMDQAVEQEIATASQAALASPPPATEAALADVYA